MAYAIACVVFLTVIESRYAVLFRWLLRRGKILRLRTLKSQTTGCTVFNLAMESQPFIGMLIKGTKLTSSFLKQLKEAPMQPVPIYECLPINSRLLRSQSEPRLFNYICRHSNSNHHHHATSKESNLVGTTQKV